MKKVIYMACVVAVMTTAQAKPMDQAKLSIHKNNIKVWTYQNAQNPVFLYIRLKPRLMCRLKKQCH